MPPPTCVGNTSRPSTIPTSSTVHPHMRGECRGTKRPSGPSAGSSPHAWGIPDEELDAIKGRRFIPTCVGNTRPPLPQAFCWPVHPHMRGEYYYDFGTVEDGYGSSPHAWGIHPRRAGTYRWRRFIPTCVGNTRPPLPQAFCWPVHPHMRGEYYYDFGTVEDGYGSSPHAWGIPG